MPSHSFSMSCSSRWLLLSLCISTRPSHVLCSAQVVNLWGYTLDFGDYYWKFSLLGGLLNLINFIATSLDLIYIGPIANLLLFPSHLTFLPDSLSVSVSL
jgi:hypothetical protein